MFCFKQAEFTPEELDSRKRKLNLEVHMVVFMFIFCCVIPAPKVVGHELLLPYSFC